MTNITACLSLLMIKLTKELIWHDGMLKLLGKLRNIIMVLKDPFWKAWVSFMLDPSLLSLSNYAITSLSKSSYLTDVLSSPLTED